MESSSNFLYAGVVVDSSTSRMICDGHQQYIPMPFQARLLSKDTEFCLLSKQIAPPKSFFDAGASSCAGAGIDFVAVISFVSNRRLCDEKLLQLGGTKEGYGLPTSKTALNKLRSRLLLDANKKFVPVWEIKLKHIVEPHVIKNYKSFSSSSTSGLDQAFC